MVDVILRPARPDEAKLLSELALRSKAHWGYDAAFLEACRTALTIDPAWCDGVHVWVAEQGGGLAGFVHLAGTPPVGELSDLFVDPPFIGTGVGRRLYERACEQARTLGFRELLIESDPGAEAFYAHMGAVRIGDSTSSVDPKRKLPLLKATLSGPRPR